MSWVMLWILAAITVPTWAFVITGNLACLTFCSTLLPPLLVILPVVRYLFPRSKEWYDLQALRIKHGILKLNERKAKNWYPPN